MKMHERLRELLPYIIIYALCVIDIVIGFITAHYAEIAGIMPRMVVVFIIEFLCDVSIFAYTAINLDNQAVGKKQICLYNLIFGGAVTFIMASILIFSIRLAGC